MRKRMHFLSLAVCLLSIVFLYVTVRLSYNVADYVSDTAGVSLSNVYGSEFWLTMDWLLMPAMAIMVVLSFIGAFFPGGRRSHVLSVVVCLLSAACLYICMRQFYSVAYFVDTSGSPSDAYGSGFWLAMAWLRMPAMALTALLSLIGIFFPRNRKADTSTAGY